MIVRTVGGEGLSAGAMQAFDRQRRFVAFAAAGIAGFVDATGFLAANSYFVSFMSGNTTRLGVDLVTSPGNAWFPALLIAGFVVGVTGGALLAQAARNRRKSAVLALTAVLLAVAASAALLAWPMVVVMLLLVAAMGSLNNTFQRQGEVAVGLTYMTGALVRMGQGIAARIAGRQGDSWTVWLLLWMALATGAVLGAATWLAIGMAGLWIPAVAAALLAAFAGRLRSP